MDRDWLRANGSEALTQLWAVRIETKGQDAERVLWYTVRTVCPVGGRGYGLGPHLDEPEDRACSQVLVT